MFPRSRKRQLSRRCVSKHVPSPMSCVCVPSCTQHCLMPRLPLAHMATQSAATKFFLERLAQSAAHASNLRGRRQIGLQDLVSAIYRNPEFEFLRLDFKRSDGSLAKKERVCAPMSLYLQTARTRASVSNDLTLASHLLNTQAGAAGSSGKPKKISAAQQKLKNAAVSQTYSCGSTALSGLYPFVDFVLSPVHCRGGWCAGFKHIGT